MSSIQSTVLAGKANEQTIDFPEDISTQACPLMAGLLSPSLLYYTSRPYLPLPSASLSSISGATFKEPNFSISGAPFKRRNISTAVPISLKRAIQVNVYNPYGKVDFPSIEDEDVSLEVAPALPPSQGRIDISIDKDSIRRLDLLPAHDVLRVYSHQIGDYTTAPPQDPRELIQRTVGFVINYERDDLLDPRELSEMPDIRLWFVRLDAAYPWLPVVLDWRGGELTRYAAMLVPHQMSRRLGIVFNPEALELFAMKKLFIIYPWLGACKVAKPSAKMNDMLKMLGFNIDDELYKLLETSTV